ncbi:MAG: DNA repair protein RecN [Candidatus Omnitrophota bacterium]|jgi:DNA repair protein RecN (Recombination protein N)
MITQLTIQNFGLIDRLSLEFGEGLNVLTGETGAGKSILIGALRYALGERFNTGQMRDPEIPCIVEIAGELPEELIKENELFKEFLDGGDRQIIINRACMPDGKNRIKLNGFSITLGRLKEIGDLLVDFHGPNDHQMLLASESHIKILDRLCGSAGPLKKTYSALYEEYKSIGRSLQEIQESAVTRERDLDLLNHQIMELERVSLERNKYEDTVEKETQLKNREKLYESVGSLIGIFESDESGIGDAISKAFPFIRALSSIDKKAEALGKKMEGLQSLSEEILSDLRAYQEKLSFEPEEARELSTRCDAYQDIIRKYGPAIEDAAAFYKKSRERYDFLINIEHNDGSLRESLKKVEKTVKEAAGKITKERRKAAAALAKTIEAELQELGIAHVRFECRVSPVEPGVDGADDVVFFISPNLGEDLKPLSEIVSSGEAARVMLALKKALTKVDPIPVLIFDEIDAQIGGRLGGIIGKKLCGLAADRQVILVTHLPQIASFAGRHFKVLKKVSGNRTITTIDLLDRAGRVKEMAQMMSGEKESGISLTHAEEMLTKAGRDKTAKNDGN